MGNTIRNVPSDGFFPQLRALVLPIAVQSFMLALVSATDAVMLGMTDQDSMSSVSLAGQVQFMLNLLVSGMAIGAGILTAQYWGRGEGATIERILPMALRMNLVFGGAFFAAAAVCPQALMGVLTNEPVLIGKGAAYLRAVSASYLLCGISQVYLVALKNTGHADVSSRISSFAVVINIVLNAVLIFGLLGFPALGVVGAAIATVLARLAELIWAVWETRKPGRVRLRWALLARRDNPALRGDFWRYTVPVMGASLVWGVAFTLYSVIMGHMGSDAVAANSVAGIAKSLLNCLIRGVSGGAGILIGNLLGAGQLEKAKAYGWRLTKLSIAIGAATGGALMLISPLIVRAVPMTPGAARYLQAMLLFCGLNIMAQSINTTVLDGIFCAGGDSRFDMIGNIFAMWCFSVPLGFLTAFGLKWSPVAVYCIVNLDEIVKLPAVFHRYRKYIWVKNLTRD